MKSSASRAEARLGAKPPSSPTAVDRPASCRPCLQRVEDLGAAAQAFGEGRRADRHDHEFLEIDRVVGMGAAVQDVHHRHRQGRGRDAADIAVERQAARVGGRLGDGEADAEDGIGAEPGLVVGAVERDHRRVDLGLVLGLHLDHRLGDLAVDRVDRLLDALAEPAALVAVALLDRLVRAGRGARGHRGAADAAILEQHLDLDRRIAAAVEDLAAVDVDDRGHFVAASL